MSLLSVIKRKHTAPGPVMVSQSSGKMRPLPVSCGSQITTSTFSLQPLFPFCLNLFPSVACLLSAHLFFSCPPLGVSPYDYNVFSLRGVGFGKISNPDHRSNVPEGPPQIEEWWGLDGLLHHLSLRC